MIARFQVGSFMKSAVLAFTMASLVVSPALAQIQPPQQATQQSAPQTQDDKQAQNRVAPVGVAQSQQDQSCRRLRPHNPAQLTTRIRAT